MSLGTLASDFWRDGFIVVEDMFEQHLMDVYQRHIFEHFGDTPEFEHNDEFLEKSATDVIPWFPQQDGIDIFDDVENNSYLKALTSAILGEDWNSLYCMTMFSAAGTQGQAWHQDCSPDNPDTFNLNRLVYTQDIKAETGGQVAVVPGSHLRGELTVGDINENFSDQLILTPRKGTLVLLHGHTWHRVLPIIGQHRVSTNYRCCPKGTPENITNICVYRNMRYQFDTSEVIEERVCIW